MLGVRVICFRLVMLTENSFCSSLFARGWSLCCLFCISYSHACSKSVRSRGKLVCVLLRCSLPSCFNRKRMRVMGDLGQSYVVVRIMF